jgi:hypothetical protein
MGLWDGSRGGRVFPVQVSWRLGRVSEVLSFDISEHLKRWAGREGGRPISRGGHCGLEACAAVSRGRLDSLSLSYHVEKRTVGGGCMP